MKKTIIVGVFSLFFISAQNLSAQSKETRNERIEKRDERRKAEQLKIAQQNKADIQTLNLSFYPTTIEPEFGITSPLTGNGNFYFTVDKTYLYMNLPYIKRFYMNPTGPQDAAINLTSDNFLYSTHTTDNVNYKITIVPADLSDTFNSGMKFVLSLNKNSGYARLVVTADNRQEITYTGSFN